MKRETLFFLLSAAIHVVVLAVIGFTWGGILRREAISVTPGISSLRLLVVRAQSPATVTPPPKLEGDKAQARKTPAEEKKPTPPSTPQNGAITPSQPDVLHNAPPAYPEAARARGIEGTATVLVHVARNGTPLEVTLAKGSGSPLLDAAALEAVRHWRFRPASIGGLAIESRVEVPICFRLDRVN